MEGDTVARTKIIETIWAFGLSAEQDDSLCKLIGKKYQIQNWPVGVAPSLMEYEKMQPCVALFSPEAVRGISRLPELSVRHLELVPKVIVLDKEYTQEELEFSVDSGISEIIRPPYTKAKIEAKIHRALEVEAVHYDVLRMSKEIIVEREILERKNDILNFLVGFLSSTSITMNTADIVEIVAEKLQLLFPVRSLQAAVWNCKDTTGKTEVYISVPETHISFGEWGNTVRASVQAARPGLALDMKISPIELKGQQEEWRCAMPSDGHVITLPISMDDRQFGVLLVLTDTVRSLSRDQAMGLNSALRHLALTIKNAQSFKIMKKHAEFDGLTGIYNRRNFEQRINEEVERAARYGHPLSIIFSDLDHFKDVNDTYGHQAGDAVLRELASILGTARRSSDYVARYGGEEFVILLPHTDIKQAHMIAERLRKQIEKHSFNSDGETRIRMTISMGVAELAPLRDKNAEALVSEADKALYRAKRAGRNRTISTASSPAKVAI